MEKIMDKSIIKGIMLKHSDGDFEYYSPQLSAEDTQAIYKILDKYGDENPSCRGEVAEHCNDIMTLLADE